MPAGAGSARRHLTVTAKITAKGRHGGTGIDSAPFIYTVDVCNGCLQTDYSDPTLVPYRYPADVSHVCVSVGNRIPTPETRVCRPARTQTIFCCGITETVGGASQERRPVSRRVHRQRPRRPPRIDLTPPRVPERDGSRY